MQSCYPGIAEPVVAPRRYDDRLTSRHRFALILDPDFGLPLQDSQHLFDRMEMRRRSAAGLAPLLEDAELRGASDSRHPHTSIHAGAPLFRRLTLMVDDTHGCSPVLATKRSCRQNE